jgi:type IV secretory pathway VirB9-like protein
MNESGLFYGFLPLALAGFATAFILSVNRFVGCLRGRGQPSEQHRSLSKRSKSMKQVFRSHAHRFFLPVLTILLAGAAVFHASPVRAATEVVARVVKYAKEDIVPVRAKLRFSTLIVLPEDEEILDFTTGDKEFWVINGAHNLCYVHPAQAGIRSNLNLITASGHVYSFLLTEISNQPNAEPDLKIFVEPKEGSGIAANNALRGYVSAGEAQAYKKELEMLRSQVADQVRAAQTQSAEQLDHFRSSYATKVQFDYLLDTKAAHDPFLVTAIYHDDAFTYIKCGAREKPALYEIKDGTPNLISFQVENGVYIAPKIIDTGYLVIGKKKLSFARRLPAN